MGIITKRRIKHARKKAAQEAQRRGVLNLKAWGYSIMEIAAKLEIPESTVRHIIKKG